MDDVDVHIFVKEEDDLHEFPEIVVKEEVVLSEDVDEDEDDNSDEDYTPSPRPTRKRTAPLRLRASQSPRPAALTAQPKRRGNVKNDYDGLPARERELLRQRRERNKLAAARCRQRREDLTKRLSDQVKAGDAKKDALQREVDDLKEEKSRLERLLREHEAVCGLKGSPNVPRAKRSRPAHLDLSLETPSSGLSLDLFLSSGSGFTPIMCPDDLLGFASHQDTRVTTS